MNDPALYTRAPNFDVSGAYATSVGILSAAPRGQPPNSPIKRSLRNLRDATVSLRERWTRDVAVTAIDRRVIDATSDSSFRALDWALESVALVTGTDEDDARSERAKQLLALVFPAGLAFTQEPFTAQWAHADRVVNLIDEKIENDIAKLVGPHYVPFIRRAHDAYGKALRITVPAEGEAAGVRDSIRLIQNAIQQYVFALFAAFPPSDSENEPILTSALAPIDAYRAAQTRAPQPSTPETPAQPATPPLPVAPPTDPIPDVQ